MRCSGMLSQRGPCEARPHGQRCSTEVLEHSLPCFSGLSCHHKSARMRIFTHVPSKLPGSQRILEPWLAKIASLTDMNMGLCLKNMGCSVASPARRHFPAPSLFLPWDFLWSLTERLHSLGRSSTFCLLSSRPAQVSGLDSRERGYSLPCAQRFSSLCLQVH